MAKHWRRQVSALILAAALVCAFSACGINTGKIKQTAKEKALEGLGKLDKGMKKSYGKDSSGEKWMCVIEHGAENLYDFHDMFGKELLDNMRTSDSLESNWKKLHDYAKGYWTNFDLVSQKNYAHGVIVSEYKVYVKEHLSPTQKEAGADAKLYHLFFVVHSPKEENPAFRGVWSVSMVDDSLYRQKGFAFAAKPDSRGQKRGISPCGIFVGEHALTLANALPALKRSSAYDKTITGPGYQKGPVTVMNDAGESPQKYSEKIAAKIETCLNRRDAKQLKGMYFKTVLDTAPETEQKIHSLTRIFTGSSDRVRITEIDEDRGTGATSMSYLLDSTGDNHVQPGFGTYYVGFRAVVICGKKKYQLIAQCCTNYERNANRLGIIKLELHPETPGGEFAYARDSVAEAGMDMVEFGLSK
ncbi:hypothetical protein HMP0721_2111 [Pseudoramibacter alactolyticus ATCC 23263]|uniref:DUF4829 domain-containing protein n=1 Tax=Pseudoramibacter alactolyticus ATCC 23263 TaxID=887929 RepID=E6MJC6_9FIRM|nr:hypothetical protein [Pseudoramibacter alactolyticus]EFV00803.1 hypothetical protein HMP0721_2111 [Pseudoramibacter alactolyticus ATCC 23263]